MHACQYQCTKQYQNLDTGDQKLVPSAFITSVHHCIVNSHAALLHAVEDGAIYPVARFLLAHEWKHDAVAD